MRRHLALPLLLGLAGSLGAPAQTTPGEMLLVLSKADRTLAIVNPSDSSVLARMPVGKDPHEVVASADGRLAYVSNYGGGAYNTLAVIDLVAQKALEPVDLGPLRGPHGLTFAGGKTWFTAEGAKAIGRYDPAEKKVDWVLGTGQNRTHMIYVSEDLKRIYTTNVSSGTVSVIEKTARSEGGPPPPGNGAPQGMRPPPPPPGGFGPPGGDWNETVIAVGRGSEGFDVSPDGRELWVAAAQDGTVSILDTAEKRVKETLSDKFPRANRLKFTPDGKLVLISGDGLAILSASDRRLLKRIDLGRAGGIQMQPDGARAYVASSGNGYVAVVDLKTLEVTGKIDAGKEPDGLAWAVRK